MPGKKTTQNEKKKSIATSNYCMKLNTFHMQEVQTIVSLRWSYVPVQRKEKITFWSSLFKANADIWLHLPPSFVCILSTCWTTSIPFPPDRERNCFCVCFTVQLGGCSAFLSTFSASCCCNLSLEHLGPKAKRKGEAKRGATGWWVVPGETKFTTNQKKLMQIHCMVN